MDSWNVGFQIAPRINAAGRMVHAKRAVTLLTTKDPGEAVAIAAELNDLNAERQKITNEIVAEAEMQINSDDKIIICLSPKDNIWPEGIIGLVASRLCEKYYKPVLVITRSGEDLKGSGRSIEEFNIIKAIEDCKVHLKKYGGHPGACGFSLTENNFSGFSDEIKTITADSLKDAELVPRIDIDAEVDINDVDEGLLEETDRFKPFGAENSKPKFLTTNVQIRDIVTMGNDGQHIKFRINSHWALAFGQAEEWKDYKIGDMIDVVYYLEMNEFNGRREVQMKLVDVRPTVDN